MEKVCFAILVGVLFFSSCKKEENGCPKCGTPVTTHYGYVKGIVLDSVTGAPISNIQLYNSDCPLTGPQYYIDTTDINGIYIMKIIWYVGDLWSNGTTQSSKPGDSTDSFINAYFSNNCGFAKFKGAQLIENDTLILNTIYTRPQGYITAHIKDTASASTISNLFWRYVMQSYTNVYPSGTDVLVTYKACPNLKINYSWGANQDSLMVNSGDTTFVDVFY